MVGKENPLPNPPGCAMAARAQGQHEQLRIDGFWSLQGQGWRPAALMNSKV